MEKQSLPLTQMTSAQELMQHHAERMDLPTTDEEMKAVLEKAPESWRDKMLVFPKVVHPADLKGEFPHSACITFAVWNSTANIWIQDYLIAGPLPGLMSRDDGPFPQHVRRDAIIPSRV